ncbi:MAG: amylo-alpha-1,6-glucosidase, partial [Bdellovibrionota bacterium]
MSIDALPSAERSGPIVIDGISYIPSSALLTGIPKVSIKDDRSFAVLDPQGESPRLYGSSELGFYFNDTRYLGIWEMTFNGMSCVPLARELRYGGSTLVFSMTNRDFPSLEGGVRIPRDTFLVRRILSLSDDRVYETVEIKNFDNKPHQLQIEHWAGGRFDDIFEVRGFPRQKRGRMLAPYDEIRGGHRTTVLSYEGLDGRIRRSYLQRFYDAEKVRVSPTLVGYFTRVTIPPKETVLIKTIVSFDQPCDGNLCGEPFEKLSVAESMRLMLQSTEEAPFAALSIETDNAIFNRSIKNAQTDIFMLLTQELNQELYPYAGIPWFSAPFGRDGMITAYQLLPWYPELARGVLNYGFQTLGSKLDPFTDEQPGKVFHEMRRGEMANTREVPFIPYYGSVDSTPLCLILLYEYIRWTLDLKSLRQWWPEALRALEWLEKWGDSDGDGFLEYAKQSPTGLLNQGWKDSNDSIMHADGTLASSPIRLCEVQGYSYRAKMGMSAMARLLGKDELASRLRLDALRLRSHFLERFWNPAGGYVVLALDGKSQPCNVKSSNMGHCLWSQILFPEHAEKVVRHLFTEEMFSGHGIRTLSSDERSYNPLSYHNGSIWPHD